MPSSRSAAQASNRVNAAKSLGDDANHGLQVVVADRPFNKLVVVRNQAFDPCASDPSMMIVFRGAATSAVVSENADSQSSEQRFGTWLNVTFFLMHLCTTSTS
jgi:hypothetical protein